MTAVKRRSFMARLFGVVGLLWFAFHAVEYVLARYPKLNGSFPWPEQFGLVGAFAEMPQWAAIALTISIWLGLLGSILLVLEDRAAVLILSLTLVASLVVLAYGVLAFMFGASMVGEIQPLFFGAGQAAFALGIWLAARTAKRYGLL